MLKKMFSFFLLLLQIFMIDLDSALIKIKNKTGNIITNKSFILAGAAQYIERWPGLLRG